MSFLKLLSQNFKRFALLWILYFGGEGSGGVGGGTYSFNIPLCCDDKRSKHDEWVRAAVIFYFFGISLILYLLSPHIIVVINILYKLQDRWTVDL